MNIFEGLASLNGAQVKVEHVKESCSIEVYGTIKVSIGAIEAELDYFAKTCGVAHIPNAVAIDDWEIQNISATIGGAKIDDFGKFRNGFRDHGMQSISDKLDLYIRRDLIIESLKTNKYIEKIYGKDVVLWDNVSKEERKSMYKLLQDNGVELEDWIINHYELREDGL